MKEKLFVCNLKDAVDNSIAINEKDIPITINDKHKELWMANDKDPYFKCQAIKYPIVANGLNYQETYFQSLLSTLPTRPIPGSKSGHADTFNGGRPEDDFILCGGRIASNGDGTGIVYLKNYIPKEGNENFIRSCKSDLVSFSTISYVDYEITKDQETGETVVNIIRARPEGLRNDALEYGKGAMKQVTNAAESGDFIDKGAKMDKKEVLAILVKNAEGFTLQEIAGAMSMTDQLVTSEHKKALAVMNSLKELKIEDPVAEINKLNKQITDNADFVRNAKLDQEFGKDGDLRKYAGKVINASIDKLDAALEEFKKDSLAVSLMAKNADGSMNKTFGTTENKTTETKMNVLEG